MNSDTRCTPSGTAVLPRAGEAAGTLAWVPALLLLLATLLGAGWAGTRPGAEGEPVAALFPPWWRAERVLAAALGTEGAILRTGGLAGVLVVQSPEPGFADRLRAAGAWVLLNPRALGGCGPGGIPR